MAVSTRNPATDEGFGELLRRFRTLAGLSQEALAAQAGLSARAISDLERGVKTQPHPDTIRRLADALGLPLTGRAALAAAARPTSRPAASPPAAASYRDLPVWPTPLIGREDEATELARMLTEAATRLLTLTGPGGVGKTRLAVAVADRLRDRFADGIAFVALAPLNDPNLVLGTIAQSLGLRGESEQTLLDQIRAHLRVRQVLLVLDNFEHLIDATTLIADLLDICPGLSVIATSREPLRIRAEQEYLVPPLAFPDIDHRPDVEALGTYGAVELFIQRVRAVRPDFGITSGVAAAVADICRRLDGLPLAIELAAAWSGALAPNALLTRLEPALPLLTRGARDLPDRQRTMQRCIAWSHDLLTAEEQALFRHLSVFVGGFTLAAAEAVGGEDNSFSPSPPSVLAGIAALVDKSLLTSQESVTGEPRFGMLETIREFGLERLAARGEGAAAGRAHAAYVVALAEQAAEGLRGPDQIAWLGRLETDLGNVRAALAWAIAAEAAEEAMRIGTGLWRFWTSRGLRREGQTWVERAVALPGAGQSPARSQALYRLGSFAIDRGDFAAARDWFARSLELRRTLDDRAGIADALDALGVVAYQESDYRRARGFHEEALALRRVVGDPRGLALSLYNLADVTREEGDYAHARALYDESLALWQQLGDISTSAYVSLAAGIAARHQVDVSAARALSEASLQQFSQLRDQHGVGAAHAELGRLDRFEGNATRAWEHFAVVLQDDDPTTGEFDMAHHWIEAIEGLGWLAADRGDVGCAARLLAAAAGYRARLHVPFPSRADEVAHTRALARPEIVNDPAWASAWQVGQTLTRDEVNDLARDDGAG
jgi:predicted ATPase/DNA-binding XRE family transcriptional regulator